MSKTFILGTGFLSKYVSKEIKNSKVLSAHEFVGKIELINKKSRKINLIINSFYSSRKLNYPISYKEYIKKSLMDVSEVLDKINPKLVKKIIYTSSSSVYGSITSKVKVNDQNNRYLYSSLKLAGESMIKNYTYKNKINLDISRVFNIYSNEDGFSIISKLMLLKKNQIKKIEINNNGQSIRDFVHVEDVAKIYKKLLKNKNSGIYDIGTGRGTKIIDIIESLNINKKKIYFKKTSIPEIYESIANTDNLKYQVQNFKFRNLKEFLKSKKKINYKENLNKNYFEKNLIGSIIYGAGFSGVKLSTQLVNFDKNSVSYFVDDDPKKIGRKINNIEIISLNELKNISKETNIRNIIIAIPSLNNQLRLEIIKRLIPISSSISSLPPKKYFKNKDIEIKDVNEISLEELFDQKNLKFEQSGLSKFYNKNILVTGGAGSIGTEICTQLYKSNVKKIIVLDHSEFNIYRLSQIINGKKIKLILGDIKDQKLVSSLISKEKIDYIFHTAAYKHVKFLEKNVVSAIKNNIFGTISILKSIKFKKLKFVFISTDKAVNPKTILGITKRASEIIIKIFFSKKGYEKSNYSIVRFGNVIGSDGSALPYFLNQIKKDLPISLTDKKMERYFMTIKEACTLVLKSCSLNFSNKILFLDMGKPVKILNLIKKIFNTYKKPDQKLKIKVIGNKFNEKISEKLSFRGKIKKTKIKKIFSVEDKLPKKNLDNILEKLQKNINDKNQNSLVKMVNSLIK